MEKEIKNVIIEKDYINGLNKIKETIKHNQAKAMTVVDSAMIMTYYEIGTIINERKAWGNKCIENLASDLKEYGEGYSIQNLKRMSQLAKEFASHEEMLWYVIETHKNGWHRTMVLNQFTLKAYERSVIEPIATYIIKIGNLAIELFKNAYVFSFWIRIA